MLPVTADSIRLFLHVCGATVWVGGQFTLACVVPVVRQHGGRDTARAAARRFQLVAWPAFGLLIVTGVWNLVAVSVADASNEYLVSLFVKLILVGISGAFALGHVMVTRRSPALGGAMAGLSLLSAIGAMFIGIQLAA
jgi:putative copper export protein